MKDKIRVLHLIKTLDLGGAETNLANMVSAFDPGRFEIHVGYSAGGVIEERLRGSGLKLYKFARKPYRIKSAATIVIIARLMAYIIKNKIDIVHSHSFNACFWGGIAARLCGRKTVEHVHDWRYWDTRDFLRRKGGEENLSQYSFARFFKYISDMVIVLTKDSYEYILAKKLREKKDLRLIPNGIPIDQARFSETPSFSNGEKVVLTSSRVAPMKNIGLIVRIAPLVLKEVPNARFLIAGTGPEARSLNGMAAAMGIGESVRFMGFQPDINGLLSKTRVFLLPSLLELHSIAILEAMSNKVPVVTSVGVGGNGDFIRDWDNGVLLDPFSDDGWAEAVIRLLKNEDLRKQIGLEGYKTCCANFNIKDTVSRIQAAYEEITQR